MKLINAYGSKVRKVYSGLITCPRCKKRKRRSNVWRWIPYDDTFVCSKCYENLLRPKFDVERRRVSDISGFGIYGETMKLNMRTYFLLTRNSVFGRKEESFFATTASSLEAKDYVLPG